MTCSLVLALAWTLLLSNIGECISPIEIKGTKLFTSEDGKQFFVKGKNLTSARELARTFLILTQAWHTNVAAPRLSLTL